MKKEREWESAQGERKGNKRLEKGSLQRENQLNGVFGNGVSVSLGLLCNI